jgi:hypothetical protein
MALLGHRVAQVHRAAKRGASAHAGALTAAAAAVAVGLGVTLERRRRAASARGQAGVSGLGMRLDDLDEPLDLGVGGEEELSGVSSVSFFGLEGLE